MLCILFLVHMGNMMFLHNPNVKWRLLTYCSNCRERNSKILLESQKLTVKGP